VEQAPSAFQAAGRLYHPPAGKRHCHNLPVRSVEILDIRKARQAQAGCKGAQGQQDAAKERPLPELERVGKRKRHSVSLEGRYCSTFHSEPHNGAASGVSTERGMKPGICSIANAVRIVVYCRHIQRLPMPYIGFDWDEGNARKNEKHGVTKPEVEQVFLNAPLLLADDLKHSQRERRFHALGRTDTDRWLHVTFTERGGGTPGGGILIRPISARQMSRKERAIYEQAVQAHP